MPDELEDQQDGETVDPSHELDMEAVFQAFGAEAEMEAMAVRTMLGASGVPALLVGSSSLPNLPFEVQVPHDRVEEARRLIEEAKAVGPSGAEEAEIAGEASA